jgi:signal transduction histidine kinase
MLKRLLSSLSLQITAGFVLPVMLFAAASLYMIGSFQRQLAYDAVVDTAARLELTAQQLHAQAMNYKQHAPRDYPAYHRDVNLYYQDLMAHVRTLDAALERFMYGELPGETDAWIPWTRPRLAPRVQEAIRTLEQVWSDYRDGLFAALGPDLEEPRLEYAAEHCIANHGGLERTAEALTGGLRRWASAEQRNVQRAVFLVVAAAIGVALLMLLVLYFKALAPLRRTIDGFQRVADGDFGHRLPVTGATEVRELTASFNRLSARLHVLFQLIERLQLGNDLDEVIRFLSQEFSDLLRIDWIGVVFVTGDQAAARLEVSYFDGHPERRSKPLFRLHGTLLARALAQGAPMHIRDMSETAARNPHYQFLRSLAERGLRDAIFLPLTPQTQTPVPAVVVFATRKRASYNPAHLRFLDNIAQLITHSFGRTVRLAEHGRLAAIGEFASGIAHELRTPLSTVKLAVDALDRLELPDNARKRLQIARQESARMQRLLEEILLYAKPIKLDPRPIGASDFLRGFVDDHRDLAGLRGQRLCLNGDEVHTPFMGDADRLTQILANLTQNACEAAPAGAEILLGASDDAGVGSVALQVCNPGPPIPENVLRRMTEPFFSTKASGTGLGLAIVQRLTRAQGGELVITSDATEGTRVALVFPRLDPSAAPAQPQGRLPARP